MFKFSQFSSPFFIQSLIKVKLCHLHLYKLGNDSLTGSEPVINSLELQLNCTYSELTWTCCVNYPAFQYTLINMNILPIMNGVVDVAQLVSQLPHMQEVSGSHSVDSNNLKVLFPFFFTVVIFITFIYCQETIYPKKCICLSISYKFKKSSGAFNHSIYDFF